MSTTTRKPTDDPSPAPAQIVHDVYQAGSQQALNRYYESWAVDYDTDVIERMGYNAPNEAATVLATWVPDRGLLVLDAGAGTGLAGEALSKLGFRHIDALDASPEMLDVAATKHVYQRLIRAELGPRRLELPNDLYDAIICVGTFTFGHVKADALDELHRILKPNGIFCFTHRTDVYADPAMGFGRQQDDMERAGLMHLLHRTEPAAYLPLVDPEIMYQIWVYRKAASRNGQGPTGR